jgi:Cd2+/Zn2+-exporting ATPase
VYLEGGRKLDFLALDKTGTITHGKPVQTDSKVLDPLFEGRAQALAASLAAAPTTRCPAPSPVRQGASPGPERSHDFAALAGRGVRGDIDGEVYHLGNHRLVEELGLCSPRWKPSWMRWSARARPWCCCSTAAAGAVRRGRHGQGQQPPGHRRTA